MSGPWIAGWYVSVTVFYCDVITSRTRARCFSRYVAILALAVAIDVCNFSAADDIDEMVAVVVFAILIIFFSGVAIVFAFLIIRLKHQDW